MITEERVIAILSQSNPVPDIDKVELTQTGATSYLATLERRSSEMTDIKTQPSISPAKRMRTGWALAAAVAVVLVGAAVAVTQLTGTDPASEPIGQLVGEWKPTSIADARIEILDSGVYTSSRGADVVDSGTITVRSDQIRFTTRSGSDCAPGDTGTYTVTTFGPDAYRLSIVTDDCPTRASDLAGTQFLRPGR